jgi:hypothetical protein
MLASTRTNSGGACILGELVVAGGSGAGVATAAVDNDSTQARTPCLNNVTNPIAPLLLQFGSPSTNDRSCS